MTIEIANRLIKLRKEKGLSQEDLANALGISRQAVSKWERAEASPDTDNLICLAKLYGISLDEILIEGTEDEDVHYDEDKEAEEGIHFKDDEDQEVIINNKGIYIKDKSGKACNIKSEKFKKMHEHYKRPRNVVCDVLNAIYPILVVIAYLILGFTVSWGWHPGWILFLTIPVFSSLLKSIRRKSICSFAYPVLVVAVYVGIGCFIGLWHPLWVLFLTIPVFYAIGKPIDRHVHRNDQSSYDDDYDYDYDEDDD